MDEETRIEADRRAVISRVTFQVEKILLDEDLTMGDMLEVMELFTARANKVFSKTKLKTIKQDYDRLN